MPKICIIIGRFWALFIMYLFHYCVILFLCKLANLSNVLFILCKLYWYFSRPPPLAHCFFIHLLYLLKFQASFVFSPVRRLDDRETTGRRR